MELRILVTGANGFVGGNILSQAIGRLPQNAHLHALSRKPIPISGAQLSSHVLDILDGNRLSSAFEEINPQVVIHAAAIADIDFCQANPDTAWKVNVDLANHLAILCSKRRARMIFVSTDTVFDGARGRYIEQDEPRPVNFYGETKVQAESLVRKLVPSWTIVRTALVVGFPAAGFEGGNTFLPKMLSELRAGNSYGVPDEEVRSPIDVLTLSRALLELALHNVPGTFHLAGSDTMNRFAMACRVAQRFGFSTELITVRNPSSIPGRAPRPRDVSLNNSKASATLRTPMLDLNSALNLNFEHTPTLSRSPEKSV